MRALRSTASLAAVLVLGVLVQAQTPDWQTWDNNPGDPKYVQLPYIVAFVATEGHSDPMDETPPHFGLDVISAANPAASGASGGLWALLPDGTVTKLFPLPVHETVPGLIDTPMGQLEKGAVVEPNMSEDGQTIYFSYFHDATWEPDGGGWQSLEISYKGADLYRLDLAPLIADNGFDPAGLAVQRLTSKEYTGPAKTDVLQTVEDRFKDAMNPSLKQPGFMYWGGIDMHLIEMRTTRGMKAVWVSNRSRTGNSNGFVADSQHNFNLYAADFLEDGSLGPAEQLQFYTTTMALSPIPLRNGLAFSYQSSTEEVRRWDIQWLDSEGRWAPLLGYGHNSELFHLGTMITDAAGTDWFLGVKYYHFNDGGFGNLHSLRTSTAGTNAFVAGPWAMQPRQIASIPTVGAIGVDAPSPQVSVNGTLKYVGKFSSPRAGRKGGEYLMAYTPTSANRWILDPDGQKGVFESYVAYRPNLSAFEPHEPIDVVAGEGLYTVVADETDQYDLVWPTPVLSWLERTGEAQQRVAEPIIDPDTTVAPGTPAAQVGTSAVYNTDVRPYDCYLTSKPYSPTGVTENEKIALESSFEGLRHVYDTTDPCRYLQPQDVLGITVRITSNRVDAESIFNPGYVTDGDAKKEASELLGLYSIVDENVADASFQAVIPADTPFEFHLLDREYGMKLVDVRSWHSLKPRETRTDCGGCHQHEAGFGIPFEGTEASQKEPMDMLTKTVFVEYDADCEPIVKTSNTPTVATPEWTADIWPQFDQHCGSCHNANVSTNVPALLALDYYDEGSAYFGMVYRDYAGSVEGALGSPAFWAAYGARTDGRDNTLPEYQPDYASGNWGYFFSSVHATDPALCTSQDPVRGEWVGRFGTWIDNHMPRNTGYNAFGATFDRYHPTVDFALVPGGLSIGYWDNSGFVDVDAEIEGTPLVSLVAQGNGSTKVALPLPVAATDVVQVIATDPAGNRQVKRKTIRELQLAPNPGKTSYRKAGAAPTAR